MQISARANVVGELDKLIEALVEGPANWMPGMYDLPTGQITQLEADTPLGRLTRYGSALPQRLPTKWWYRSSGNSLEAEGVFPAFNGELRLSRLPNGTNQLELNGDYYPPGGIIGRAADAAAMYAVAQATLQDFVQSIAGVLARNALGRSVDEQVRAGRLTLESDPPGS